jgi:phage host-nuclease inhibitor protein Gam
MAKKISKATIKDWQEAEAKLGEIRRLTIEIALEKDNADLLIQKIRDRKKEKIDLLGNQGKKLLKDLEVFCSQNKKDMLPLKSKKVEYGRMGFRDQPKFKYPKAALTLINRLKQLGLKKYIKVKETPDKEAISTHYKKLPLKELGVTRKVEKDVFYIEFSD